MIGGVFILKDKTLLNIITIIGMAGWAFLFRKGPIKDWFLIYLCKTLVSTLLDSPVGKKKYVTYPKRPFSKYFDSNIVFLYVLFPLSCVLYNQFTYKMKALKAIPSVLIFSAPMAIVENILEKNTQLVKYGKGWSGLHTFTALTVTFWIVRAFIQGIRFLSQKRERKERTITSEENTNIEIRMPSEDHKPSELVYQ